MRAPLPDTFRAIALATSTALVLAACSEAATTPAGPSAPPPTKVTVITTEATSVPLTSELPGRSTARLVAEIRPQVTGIVQKRLFREGSEVKAGDTLYQIDPASYQATLDSAQASLARAEATLATAKLKADRYAGLVDIKAVSRQDNDDAQAALLQARADVATAKAAVQTARINLGYTRITSPISGRIGRSSVTAGALVTANQAAALATVQQLDPINVDLTQSSSQMLDLRRRVASGELQRDGNTLPVTLTLEDGSAYAHPGKLAFSEVSVDASTGSVTLRAEFPNPDGLLLPGMYVRAKVTQGETAGAILLPHAAISHDPRGNAVAMVVGPDKVVQARTVTLAGSREGNWIVTAGLQGGEQVIVEGLQKVRAGATVAPEPTPAAR
ncbi:MAG: efflux RND transporter periplasmic adaptor subunit [Rhodocyclaceae bacterium]|nr:efflux RND transporter periplasmic adaptor subunit [Rhodocyclaceae bacterium]